MTAPRWRTGPAEPVRIDPTPEKRRRWAETAIRYDDAKYRRQHNEPTDADAWAAHRREVNRAWYLRNKPRVV